MSYIKGSCEEFCPEQEAKLRIAENLLHFFELKNGEKRVPGVLIRAFARSAAGVKTPKSKDLRTERCLQRTIEYLLKDVILDKRKSYNVVYDFAFDRMRAIRQEIVMQNYNDLQTIRLLEPMITFLCYSYYSLCEETIENFDPKMCGQHLQECLKRALCCYDQIGTNDINLNQLRRRIFIEAIYQLFNLGSTEALNRGITLPEEIRSDKAFAMSFGVALNYYQGNLYRVLSTIVQLPHLLCAIASLKVQGVRYKLFKIFAHSYNSKQLTVPAEFIRNITKHKNLSSLYKDCKYYNIKCVEKEKIIHFVKSDFKSDAAVLKPKHEYFVEEQLKNIYLPEVLLLMKF